MHITQKHNLRLPNLSDRVAQLINLDEEITAIFRGIYVKANGSWIMLMGNITLNDCLNSADIETSHYRYPEYQFVSQTISGLHMAQLISNPEQSLNILVPSFPKLCERESDLNWTESLIPSHVLRKQFSVRRFSAQLCSGVDCRDTKLVAHNMPFYQSAFELIKKFLRLDKFHGYNDARNGELCIYVPEPRGRLALSEGHIRFHSGTHNELSVVGAIDGEQVNLVDPKDMFEFDLKSTKNLEVWLVTNDNEIIDYYSSTEWHYPYESQSGLTDLKNLISMISCGESEHCEFKPYINLTNPDTKAIELEKTVCALSNHQGGILFIGVNDETNIIGVNKQCKKDYKCSLNEAIEYYLQCVDKRLKEALSKNQCFSCRTIEYNELIVLVVDVQKANGLNYLISTNDAYIRRGASSPKMTPTEMQAFPVERDMIGRELLISDIGSGRGGELINA